MQTAESLYDLLGVPEDADPEDIERAYRRQLRVLHPDLAADEQERAERDRLCRDLGEAYHTLIDPGSRAK